MVPVFPNIRVRVRIKTINQLNRKMQNKRSWTKQEDEKLKLLVQSTEHLFAGENFEWHVISQRLKDHLSVYKTPKQCKDRWNHHLKPGNSKECEWTNDEQIQLFALQQSLGNKWVEIASKIPNKSDNIVKNFFYATMRKSMRLINSFIVKHRNEEFYKNLKTFPENCIGKIIALDQNKKTGKLRITKDNIAQSAREIKSLLLEISRTAGQRQPIQQAIHQISEFNRNCKRLRCKRKRNSDELSDQECASKLLTTSLSFKTRKDSTEEQRFKHEQHHEQLLQTEIRTTKQDNSKRSLFFPSINELIFKERQLDGFGKKECVGHQKPRYQFECDENILLFSKDSERNQYLNELLRQKSKDNSTERANAFCPINAFEDRQKVGKIPQLQYTFLRDQQLFENSQLSFENYLQRIIERDEAFHEEYL